MDRIILEVNDTAAKRWRFISKEKRDKLTSAFNRIITTVGDSDEEFLAFLDKISRTAAVNGLTEEILNELLNEE